MRSESMKNNIIRDLVLIVFSIVAAIMLAKTGVLTGILANMQEWKFLGSFLSGMFFVSIFTAAPAAAVLFEIAASNSIWAVAFFGGGRRIDRRHFDFSFYQRQSGGRRAMVNRKNQTRKIFFNFSI